LKQGKPVPGVSVEDITIDGLAFEELRQRFSSRRQRVATTVRPLGSQRIPFQTASGLLGIPLRELLSQSSPLELNEPDAPVYPIFNTLQPELEFSWPGYFVWRVCLNISTETIWSAVAKAVASFVYDSLNSASVNVFLAFVYDHI